jgi:hypothetical protein
MAASKKASSDQKWQGCDQEVITRSSAKEGTKIFLTKLIIENL